MSTTLLKALRFYAEGKHHHGDILVDRGEVARGALNAAPADADILDALKSMVAFTVEPDPESKSVRDGLLASAFAKARSVIAKAEARLSEAVEVLASALDETELREVGFVMLPARTGRLPPASSLILREAGMGKLTGLQMRILRSLDDAATDTFDLSDSLKVSPATSFAECCKLKSRGLVEWLYPEDEVCISVAGRQALSEGEQNG